ncbi:MAG: plasmid stabilization protein [Streptosporangiales bacterium]|nr:plasmid stabilization protein [Streptosporangiales bacterium]
MPKDAATIGAAVRRARPGDLVLVSPGTYRESVTVETPRLTLRGTSRADVVVDGEARRGDGIVVRAPGVAVQNLTVRDHIRDGVLVTGGPFLVSHVTAVNNRRHGVSALSADDGVIEHSYASGSAGAGFSVGRCGPCDVVVREDIAERDAVGFEGTNASDGLVVAGNRLVGNRVGLTTDSDDRERLAPQRGAVVVGNLIAANDERATPAAADGAFGVGAGIRGGMGNKLLRNRVVANRAAGVLVTSTGDLAPVDNHIVGNRLAANGNDVVFAATVGAPGRGNCLADNVLETTSPDGLVAAVGCPAGDTRSPSAAMPDFAAPPGVPSAKVEEPPAQPQLPDASTAGPTAVPAEPAVVDVDGTRVPPTSLLARTAAVEVR